MGTHRGHFGRPLDGLCQETQGPAARILARTGELERELTECRRAMREVQVSEERYRTIFEHAVLGIYRTTPDGRILAANPALVRMLGYERFAELAGRNLEDTGFEPGHPRAAFKDRIEAEGQVVGLESAWIRRDGTTLYVRENARVVRDEQGEVKYYEGTVEDITGRKRTKEALQASEVRYRAIVENSLVGIGISNGDRIVYANRSLLRMYGYDSFEEFAAKSLLDHLTPGSRALVEQWRERLRQGEEMPPILEHDIVRTRGDHGGGHLLQGKDAHLVFIRDITQRKRAEETIMQSHELLRANVHQSSRRHFHYQRGHSVHHRVQRGRRTDVRLRHPRDGRADHGVPPC